jgi:C4-dicarboxylate-specific signal transduction histidine kinase
MPDASPPSSLQRISELEAEIVRLNKIVNALMNRAERDMGGDGSHFRMFQTTVTLEKQIHDRTRALETALQENERITRALKREKEEQQALIIRLEETQRQLVQSEKLASLGAIVAGVAHELNTPIGNGLMAISTLSKAITTFREGSVGGIKRSALDSLLHEMDTGSSIALRNLHRAAELISSFKQVAADQSSAQRRTFDLGEMIAKIMLTLQPTLRRSVAQFDVDIPTGIQLDSYPGPLSQILVNLIGNTTLHAFDGRPEGHVRLHAAVESGKNVRIWVEDNGIGIPPELLPRIFDPFVTSKMGRGGTGLDRKSVV